MDIADIGNRVATGQRFAMADVQGNRVAVWFLGQKGGFHNPVNEPVNLDDVRVLPVATPDKALTRP